MFPSVVLICIGVSGVVACVGYVGFRLCDRYTALVNGRIREVRASSSGRSVSTLAQPRPPVRLGRLAEIPKHLLPNRDEERRRYQSRLIRAGIYSPTALSAYFAAKLGLMVLPPIVGMAIAMAGTIDHRLGIPLGCAAGLFGIAVPSLWLQKKIRSRQRALRRALPDLLDLMTVCLEGGLSLHGTLLRVSDELRVAHPALAGELAIVQRELELGVAIFTAFRRLADRTGCEDLRQLSTLARDAQRQGMELASGLRIFADTLRHQREVEAEETCQKASVKILIPTMLFIFPAVFVVLAGPAAIRIHETFNRPTSSVVKVQK